MESPFEFRAIDSLDCINLELADGQMEEVPGRRCVWPWLVVRRDARRAFTDDIPNCSPCLVSVERMAYTILLICRSDGTNPIIEFDYDSYSTLYRVFIYRGRCAAGRKSSTIIVSCTCFPIMPKSIQCITGKTKMKIANHQSPITNHQSPISLC